MIKAKITDYGVELIDAPHSSLHEMPKVKVKFEITQNDTDFPYDNIFWDGLFLNSKGEINKKTFKNLFQMGFDAENNDMIMLAEGPESDLLDMGFEYFLQIGKNDKGYWRVEWINRQESAGLAGIKKVGQDSLRKKFAAMRISGEIKKLYSEQKKDDRFFDPDDELPF